MKIGIITYWSSQDNYGQLLQCFALQHYLRTQGHDAFLIKYKEAEPVKSSIKIAKIFQYILHFKQYVRFAFQLVGSRKYEKTADNNKREFSDFLNRHIHSTDKVYTKDELMCDAPEADAYICGSDQIWGGDDIYYLPFVNNAKLKIAYAPSFGGLKNFSEDKAAEIKQLVSHFSFIGMREASGVKLLNELGIHTATQVVDPTLLLDAKDYDNISDSNAPINDCFVYLLGSPIVCNVGEIFDFIREKELSYTYVASQGRVDKYKKSYLTIPQWIKSLQQSKLVITNSFHCVVFAMIFKRPFIFIPLSGSHSRMNDRLEDLFGKSRLTSQIYRGNFDDVPLNIDFNEFENYKAAEDSKVANIFKGLLSND